MMLLRYVRGKGRLTTLCSDTFNTKYRTEISTISDSDANPYRHVVSLTLPDCFFPVFIVMAEKGFGDIRS